MGETEPRLESEKKLPCSSGEVRRTEGEKKQETVWVSGGGEEKRIVCKVKGDEPLSRQREEYIRGRKKEGSVISPEGETTDADFLGKEL